MERLSFGADFPESTARRVFAALVMARATLIANPGDEADMDSSHVARVTSWHVAVALVKMKDMVLVDHPLGNARERLGVQASKTGLSNLVLHDPLSVEVAQVRLYPLCIVQVTCISN